ncbi:hypothetical protein [Microbulbifer sp. PSTR4-B]|uniref:hypothetical protein n=1 Tax=Microbulbifer sp. PSTR4-B TaxID=3243396 RepID=UPI00403A4615
MQLFTKILINLFTPVKTPKSFVQQFLKENDTVTTLMVYRFKKYGKEEVTSCLSILYDLVELTSAPHSKPYYLSQIKELQKQTTKNSSRNFVYRNLEKMRIPIYIHFCDDSTYFIINHEFFSGYTGLLVVKCAKHVLQGEKARSEKYYLKLKRLYHGSRNRSLWKYSIDFLKALFLIVGLILYNRRDPKKNPFYLKGYRNTKGAVDDIAMLSAKVSTEEPSLEDITEKFIVCFTEFMGRKKANIIITQEFTQNLPKQHIIQKKIGNTACGFKFSFSTLNKSARQQIHLLQKYDIAYYGMVLLDVLGVKKRSDQPEKVDFMLSYLPIDDDDCIAVYAVARDTLNFTINKYDKGYWIYTTANKAAFDIKKITFFLRKFSVECNVTGI